MSAFLDAHPRYSKVLAAKRVSLRLQGRGTMDVVAEAQEWKRTPGGCHQMQPARGHLPSAYTYPVGRNSAPSLPNACHC